MPPDQLILVLVLRAFERFIIEFTGLMAVVLGAVLFKWGILDSNTDLEFEGEGKTDGGEQPDLRSTDKKRLPVPSVVMKLKLLKATPGTLFCLFGMTICLMGLNCQMKIEPQQLPQPASNSHGASRTSGSPDSSNVKQPPAVGVTYSGSDPWVLSLYNDLDSLNEAFKKVVAELGDDASKPSATGSAINPANSDSPNQSKPNSAEAVLVVGQKVASLMRARIPEYIEFEQVVAATVSRRHAKGKSAEADRLQKRAESARAGLLSYLRDANQGAIVLRTNGQLPTFGMNPPSTTLIDIFKELQRDLAEQL